MHGQLVTHACMMSLHLALCDVEMYMACAFLQMAATAMPYKLSDMCPCMLCASILLTALLPYIQQQRQCKA